ncbi:MAG TPA: MgtC/SapB family protein [Geminicoccus sp.]|uniref:MgtC/SapB family protein n=1 Tax=Geminicoccus sp. TaxID=2024832 RepID=UPI002C3131C5|nr:MgtC/SapB family protein [Geminicoccus sp.]HWL70164.1 MgtC/SapB family protein [Geminicoccus sp.]
MFSDELLHRLAVALAIGLLVGLERGWRARGEGEGRRAAGFRTFALSGLLGGICAALVPLAGALVLAAGLLAFTLAFAAFHWLEAQADRDFSATGVVAGILTFALGAYAVLGEIQVAVAAAVAVVALLAFKQPLHAWLRRLTWPEIRAGLVLLAMSFLLLPLLPDRTVDPWNALNPAEIWLLAIIIAALSFVGYMAVRVIGARAGIVLVAVAGALASSTAVTLTLARMAKGQAEGASVLAGGILLASAVMAGRVLVVAFALNPALVLPLAWPLGAAILVFLASSGFLLLRRTGRQGEGPELTLTNPLELRVALKLAAIIAVIMLLAKLVGDRFGATGLYVLAAVSGLADVDALTLSMARMGGSGITLAVAAGSIAIAVAVNTAVKCVMAGALGSPRLGLLVTGASAVAIAAGAGAFLLAQG